MNLKAEEKTKQNLSKIIREYLLARKFNLRYKGTFYLRAVIKHCLENREEPFVLNNLFIEIAKKYNTFPVQVYKNVRYAINNSLDSKFEIKQFIVIAVFELTN